MTEYEDRYDNNGEDLDHNGSSPLLKGNSHGGHDSDSKSQHSRDYERESSKSRDRERDKDRGREKDRDKERDRDREKERDREREKDRERGRGRSRDRVRDGERERSRERDRHHKDRDRHRERERSERRDHDRGRDDDDYHRSRDYERRRDYDRDREERHGHRSKSRSRARSEHRSKSRSRSRSRSRSKSKRVSGFDMAPPAPAMLANAAVTAAATEGKVGLLAPLCNGGEPTSVAYMHKGHSVLRFNGSSSTGNCLFWPDSWDHPGSSWNVFKHVSYNTWTVWSYSCCYAGPSDDLAGMLGVGGLSPTANEQSVATFFSHVMSAIGGNTAGPGDAVVNVYINHEKKFAFVEMRSVEEASNAMALDGIIFEVFLEYVMPKVLQKLVLG